MLRQKSIKLFFLLDCYLKFVIRGMRVNHRSVLTYSDNVSYHTEKKKNSSERKGLQKQSNILTIEKL